MSKPHLLNNSLALSSSLRAKDCNRSYLASLGLVFKLVWVPFHFQYGINSRCYSTATVLANLARPTNPWAVTIIPLRTRRPRRVPDQPKYHQNLLSWPRPIRLVLTVSSVRPVPAHPRCPRTDPPRARAHAGGICIPTRPCSCLRTCAHTCP